MQEKSKTTLMAAHEHEEYTSFGLGYGVDATEPSPLRGKHGKVRTVLPNMKNVEETLKNERKAYLDAISSISSFNAHVSLSVADITAQALQCSIEGEHNREMSRELLAKGRKGRVKRLIATLSLSLFL